MTLQSKIQIVPRSPLKYPLVSQMLKYCSLSNIPSGFALGNVKALSRAVVTGLPVHYTTISSTS